MRPVRGLFAGQAAPSAHRGFLNRARAVPVESLYDMACRQGRRLVLTGAALGFGRCGTLGFSRCGTLGFSAAVRLAVLGRQQSGLSDAVPVSASCTADV